MPPLQDLLPPRLSELVILITARSWTQNYEWYAHYDLAIQGGLDPEIAKAIAEGRRPNSMASDEEVLYSFVAELLRNQGVSDVTYAQMESQFGEKGVIDAVGIAGYYTLISMVLNTARTPLPEGVTPALAPLPR